MNKYFVILITILVITVCLPKNVSAEEFSNTDQGELTTLEYKTKYIKGGPGQKIHIVFESDRPANLYIVKPSKTLYRKTDTVESDYFDDIFVLESKLNRTHYDFYWEVPENRGYVLYYHNPNYGNVTYELKYTDAYYESLDDLIYYSVLLIVLIVVIAVIIYLFKRARKRRSRKGKHKKRRR